MSKKGKIASNFLLSILVFILVLMWLEFGAFYYFLNVEEPIKEKLLLDIHSIFEQDFELNPPPSLSSQYIQS
jgi:hypothetical protein